MFLCNLAGEIREGICHEDSIDAVHHVMDAPIHNEHSEPHLCHVGHCGHLVLFEGPAFEVAPVTLKFVSPLVPQGPWRDLAPLVRPPKKA